MTHVTTIYIPGRDPYAGSEWTSTLLGRVVRPAVRSASGLDWFWFTFYGPKSEDEDSEFLKLPREVRPGGKVRYLRLRWRTVDIHAAAFIARIEAAASAEGCAALTTKYSPADDVGSDRFALETTTADVRRERADLVTRFLHASALLVLHTLAGPDEGGRHHFEHNPNANASSSLFAPRHLFSNMGSLPE